MPTAEIMVNVFDGTRRPMTDPHDLFIRVIDGNQKEVHSGYHDKASVLFTGLAVFDNWGDDYTVLASMKGYTSAGFRPVKVAAGVLQRVDLILLPRKWRYEFDEARWDRLAASHPKLAAILGAGVSAGEAQQRYEDLIRQRPASVAGLLNITTAMENIHLPAGTPMDYLEEVIWDETLAQDRFFGWADPALIGQVRQAAMQGLFEPEIGPAFFHPGATCSWKQVQFGEANVQLTFHENDRHEIGGLNCVKIEPDIDYYQDLGAHALLEVLPSTITGGLSDPNVIYALRWIAGRHSGVPDFNPPYTIDVAA